MSLQATLANALSGLNVSQRALSVTAHNVANANTEGYARKIVEQESVFVGDRGAGARTLEVARLTDRFLTAEVRRQSTRLGESLALDRYHGRIQGFFGAPGDSRDLATQIGGLAAALEALANSPETGVLGTEVVNRAEQLSDTIGDLAGYIQRLRGEADREIGGAVAEINHELGAIAELNAEITRLAHAGQSSADLQDRRDRLVKSLAEKLDIHTIVKDGGALAVFTSGGITLLDGRPRVLVYDAASLVTSETTFGAISVFRQDQIDPATGKPIDPSAGLELVSRGVRAALSPELQNDGTPDADQLIISRLGGGRLQGLLGVRDRVLPELDDQVQELAEGLRFALNAAHNAGVAFPPPASLVGTRTDLADFAGAARSGSATFAIIDKADGSTLAAFQVDVGAAADETALVAQINAGLGALGTAAIGADGRLQIHLADPGQGLALAEGDSAITIEDAAGRSRTYGFSHYFGLNDLFVLGRERASSLQVRADLRADPSRLATARLDVEGPPLVATLGGRGDNRGAQELAAALRGEHDVIARGGLAAQSIAMGDYAAAIIARAASQAAHADEAASRDRAMADALDFRLASVSGVNLDEEMARLVQLQKAYTVAARLISITDQMFDELFRVTG